MYSVLILDDNIPTATMIKQAITWEEINCQVVGVIHNGIDGKAAIEQMKPDLIISDIEMPGLTGLEMIEATSGFVPKCRVIFISAFEKFTYAHHAIKLGAVDFLIKPFTRNELIQSVSKAIKGLNCVQDTQTTKKETSYSPFMQQVLTYLSTVAYSPITLEMVAEHFQMSPSTLGRLIKKETNLRYVELLTSMRINRAKQLLSIPNLSVSDVARRVGYGDYLTFYKVFTHSENQSPSDYRKKLQGGKEASGED